ncbi:methyltransferase [Kibdelosporangium aridum]|uniref:Release factor glutamine methyltransferase n=1 Tax=Kibdelosporangium aridum TaxID=2030 RepID=A0A1Y5YA59_KIBAR|nr:methyltransferase [Kibdelosporangium aridum]SMD26519.1 release factor glutamine methyltransferase [Kibdelosporangium aridum]
MEARDFELIIGQNIIDRYHADDTRSDVFELLGRQWDLLDDVWPPAYSPGGELYADLIPFGEMSAFLEMGCGTGIMSVLAALAGTKRVLGLDLNPNAVRNTEMNAKRHGVADRVTARESDLYSAVEPGEKFDGIYWNPPFFDAPEEFVDNSIWHETMFDPNFAKLRTFLKDGLDLLTPSGKVYLWFGEALGNPTLVGDLAKETGYTLNILKKVEMDEIPEALADAFPADLVGGDPGNGHAAWHLHLIELTPLKSSLNSQ